MWPAEGKGLVTEASSASLGSEAAGGEPGSPAAPAVAGDAAALARELADVKKRFVAVAKRKQQEYTKRVPLPPTSVTC